ncbi:C-type lectin lectoxin-Thr1-like [Scleropages formosus]|uniref:Si:dkey-9i23.5 n=1 Tax=Scleropages formosus TaxID=113540 RepID=A0A8C9QNP7_SCLFO|nr:C-type lectin lectoxin-Thr1-like [Scleropages formosus]XP_018610476.2 C-type lectin lectoxin-Thr1-like [Scleropages formosus]
MKASYMLVITVLWLSANARILEGDNSAVSVDLQQYCATHFPKACKLNDYQDWYQISSFCVKYFSTPANFSDAEFSCRSKAPGGHLVSVHNDQANTNLLCLVMKYNYTNPRVWLGALELFTSNQFIWTDGSEWNFQFWVPGQPDNTANQEDCVEMNWKNTGHWNDDRCHVKKSYMCSFSSKV